MSQLKEISGQSNLTLENVICNMNITDNYWESITKKSNVLFVKSIKVQYRIIKLFILL